MWFFHNPEIIFFTFFFTFLNLDFFLALKPLQFIVSTGSYLLSATPLTVLYTLAHPHPHTPLQRHIVFPLVRPFVPCFGNSSQSSNMGRHLFSFRKQIVVIHFILS